MSSCGGAAEIHISHVLHDLGKRFEQVETKPVVGLQYMRCSGHVAEDGL